MRVSVIGGSTVTDEQYRQAREVGKRLGEHGHEVVCGGLTGVMEAACAGASEAGGHTIGILPGERTTSANDHVETAIATGLGNARNVLVVMNGAAVIAVDGGTGTLSELGHALDMGRPVAGLGTHRLGSDAGGDAIEHVDTPVEAVEYVESAVQ
ncbi:MAG: TIGR00725 family protein [Haloarcula sp.]